MAENVPLLPPPPDGWEWKIQEISLGGSIYFAMVQQRQPEPPQWWEEIYQNPEYSHAITALTFLVLGAKKIRDAWKGRAT